MRSSGGSALGGHSTGLTSRGMTCDAIMILLVGRPLLEQPPIYISSYSKRIFHSLFSRCVAFLQQKPSNTRLDLGNCSCCSGGKY